MSFLIHALSFLTNFLLSLNLKCMENRLLDFKEKKDYWKLSIKRLCFDFYCGKKMLVNFFEDIYYLDR